MIVDNDYTYTVVFNEIEDGQRVYYRVVDHDKIRDIIRIEHLNDIPDGTEAIDLNDIRKERINIAYYSKYDDKERN